MHGGYGKFSLREPGGKLISQAVHDRVFRAEMICVDEVYPKFCGMQELVVFDIGSHICVAALCVSVVNAVAARASHHRESVYRVSGGIVSQPLYLERSLALF